MRQPDHRWDPYDELMRHAEAHLELFQVAAEFAPHNEIGIGQQAHNTIEFAMKALLEAHAAPYQTTHNVSHLLDNIRGLDEELKDFSLSIPHSVYTVYKGTQQHQGRRQPAFTEYPNYRERTVSDAERIINRAKQVRSLREK